MFAMGPSLASRIHAHHVGTLAPTALDPYTLVVLETRRARLANPYDLHMAVNPAYTDMLTRDYTLLVHVPAAMLTEASVDRVVYQLRGFIENHIKVDKEPTTMHVMIWPVADLTEVTLKT